MNQKLRAVLQTSAIGAFCVAVSFGVQHMVANMTSEQFVSHGHNRLFLHDLFCIIGPY
jgi:hypothetical protein